MEDPLGDIIGRYARTRAPFTTAEASDDLGLPAAVVAGVLERLEASGRVARGAFRPHGEDQEWADTEVLRRIRRRSLAALRKQAEPAEPAALAMLLPEWQGVGSKAAGPDRLVEIARVLQGSPIPASILEHDVLPARMSYQPELLDQLTASGEMVWVGRGPLGARDGRVALYLRDQIPLLHLALEGERPKGTIHTALRRHLQDRGASFFRDLYQAAGGGDPGEVLDALWDLVWSGEVTNDTIAPLRAFLWGKVRSRTQRRPHVPGSVPPSATGRWYLVTDLVEPAPPITERAAAVVRQLLDRNGLLTRSVVSAEGVPGGFSAVYPVLRAMEDAGRVRRGYFVEGQGGTQFSLPGAVDRLRRRPESEARLLAAADPANPYGAAIPWVEHPAGRPSRSAGAFVLLVDGELVAFVERGGRKVITFTDDDEVLDKAAGLIVDLAATRLRRMEIEMVDGAPTAHTPFGARLAQAGFRQSYKGLAYRG